MIELLQARLRSDPNDVPAWLVFGDWLLEHDDIRGELIRLERHESSHYKQGSAASRKLTVANEAKWRAWLAEAPTDLQVTWHHGFAWGFELPFSAGSLEFLERALVHEEAVLLSSIRFDVPRDAAPGLDARLRALPLDRIHTIAFNRGRGRGVGDATMLALAKANLAELETLDVERQDVSDRGAIALAGAPLERLRVLSLRYNRVGAAGARAIAAPRRFEGGRPHREPHRRRGARRVPRAPRYA